MRFAVVALSALLVASPALAQGQSNTGGAPARSSNAGAQDSSNAGANEGGERRICRRVETSENRTGARRVCMTAAEWREYSRDTSVY